MQTKIKMYIFTYITKKKQRYINKFLVNRITMTRKSDEHLSTTYENTGQMLRFSSVRCAFNKFQDFFCTGI